MDIEGQVAVVTGAASGLGLATAQRLAGLGASVILCDLEGSDGEVRAREIGGDARFRPGDVTSREAMNALFAEANADGRLRAVVHCAGRGAAMRVIEADGSPGALDTFAGVVTLNVVGTFNVIATASAQMARNPAVDFERGVIVTTASLAAFEGQVGQIPYASAKAGVAGMTIVAARDLAEHHIRVCSIAPGPFDTPAMQRAPGVREVFAGQMVNPPRLGRPPEYAALACHIIENGMLNGEVIRLDAAIRMPPVMM